MSPDSTFEVIPLGAGNYFASRRFFTSLLLVAGGRTILVDCPDPLVRMFAEASAKSGRNLSLADVDDILLTHMHGDHCNGLECFGFYKKYVHRKPGCARIFTSRAVSDVLWRKLSVSMADAVCPELNMDEHAVLGDYFDVRPFEFGETLEIHGIRIETRRTIHSLPTFGFRATFGGRTFGYSCDTYFDPGMIEFLADADLIFHECDKGIHTAQASLEALPKSIRQKMRLVHLGDDFEGSALIEAAEEGRVYRV